MEKITGTLNVIKKFPLSKMGNPHYVVSINNKISGHIIPFNNC